MPDLTTNHGLQLWAAGEADWEHRTDMQAIERALTVRDLDANLANYTAYDGARFEATDTGSVYRGDGTSWQLVDIDVGALSATSVAADSATLSGNLQMGDLAEILFSIGGDIEAQTDSTIAGEENRFVVEIIDVDTADTIRWRRKANSTDAFQVFNFTTGESLFRVRDDGEVEVAEYIDLNARDGSGDTWRFITYDTTGNFVFQHYPSGGGFTDAFEIDASGNVTFPNGTVTASSGTVQQQRGAPTTSELADGNRMQYTSDGTDAHSAGDLVSARNNAGTIVSQVIAAAADDT